MKRNVSLDEITDGKIYTVNDMVRADTGGCQGCHVCCTGMGESITLDPYDVYRLTQGLACSFDELNQSKLSWHREDMLMLPNLKVEGKNERCIFSMKMDGVQYMYIVQAYVACFPLGDIIMKTNLAIYCKYTNV